MQPVSNFPEFRNEIKAIALLLMLLIILVMSACFVTFVFGTKKPNSKRLNNIQRASTRSTAGSVRCFCGGFVVTMHNAQTFLRQFICHLINRSLFLPHQDALQSLLNNQIKKLRLYNYTIFVE